MLLCAKHVSLSICIVCQTECVLYGSVCQYVSIDINPLPAIPGSTILCSPACLCSTTACLDSHTFPIFTCTPNPNQLRLRGPAAKLNLAILPGSGPVTYTRLCLWITGNCSCESNVSYGVMYPWRYFNFCQGGLGVKLASPVPRVAPVLQYCWEWPIPPWGNMFTKMKATLVIIFSCKGGH